MRKNILWGVLFILIALALTLNAFGINFGIPSAVPIWKIILSLALIVFIIDRLIAKKFSHSFFPLVFIVMIFEKEFAVALGKADGDIAPAWLFLVIALLLTVGTSLITKNFTFTFKKGNDTYVFSGDEGREKYKEVINQNSVYYFDCASPINKELEISLGSTEIFFTNVELYQGDGIIKIENSLGKVVFHIPENWTVDCQIENSLGSIQMAKPNPKGENSKTIKITGENSLGKIEFVSAK